MTVTRLGTTVVWMFGPADILERRHKAGSFGDARGPFFLWQILDALSRDGFLCIVVPTLRDAFQIEACTIEPWCSADTAVPSGIMPGDADGYVPQWVVHRRPEA